MLSIGFKYSYMGNKEEYEPRINNIGEEENLNGEQIKTMLTENLTKKGLLVVTERSHGPAIYKGMSNRPFDVVCSTEKSYELVGFEIKGDTDNFKLLAGQMSEYLYSMDEVYLVLHKKTAPDWLPSHVGVLRVFANGEFFIEKHSSVPAVFEVSIDSEWEAFMRQNGLGKNNGSRTRTVMKTLGNIRRAILWHRYFGNMDYENKEFRRFQKLSDKEIAVLIGFDVPYQYKSTKKDVDELEKRINTLKELINIGLRGTLEQEKIIDTNKKV